MENNRKKVQVTEDVIKKGKHWNTEKYEKNARFVSDYGIDVISWLDPKPHEYILDLGCGDGVLTKKIIEFGCKVLGVDGSLEFVNAAKKNRSKCGSGRWKKSEF